MESDSCEPVVDAIVGMNGLSVQESDDDEDSSQSESEEYTDLFKHIFDCDINLFTPHRIPRDPPLIEGYNCPVFMIVYF